MKKFNYSRPVITPAAFAKVSAVALVFAAEAAFAQVGGDSACGRVTMFAGNVQNILNAVSVVVVTIAVIFAGYQIAFAHKRIADVAPVLLGGMLIGAAAQIAKMLLPDQASGGGANGCTLIDSAQFLLARYA